LLLVVSGAHDGARLDNFLREKLRTVSLGTIQKLLRKHEVLVNGEPAERSSRLSAGDRVELPLEAVPPIAPSKSVHFGVIYEDDAIIVIDKPAGLVVHPGPGHRADTLLNGLFSRWGGELAALGAKRSFGLVHRLDRGTSGVMVVAKTIRAHEHLTKAFARREIKKTYLALVAGMPPKTGVIEDAIGQSSRLDRRRMVSNGGARRKSARTEYELVELFPKCALLRVHPKTGRMHQIRVHLAAAGFPIVGDAEYGNPEINRLFRAKCGVKRPFLHAVEVAFVHPQGKLVVHYDCPLAEDLEIALEILRRKK